MFDCSRSAFKSVIDEAKEVLDQEACWVKNYSRATSDGSSISWKISIDVSTPNAVGSNALMLYICFIFPRTPQFFCLEIAASTTIV
jgi:hypothetical protein